MTKLNRLPITSAARSPLEPPISCPTSRKRPSRPAISTKVLRLFIRPLVGSKKRARPRPLRFRVDEGLALRHPVAFRMNRARTGRTVLTIHPSAHQADKLLPFSSLNIGPGETRVNESVRLRHHTIPEELWRMRGAGWVLIGRAGSREPGSPSSRVL